MICRPGAQFLGEILSASYNFDVYPDSYYQIHYNHQTKYVDGCQNRQDFLTSICLHQRQPSYSKRAREKLTQYDGHSEGGLPTMN